MPGWLDGDVVVEGRSERDRQTHTPDGGKYAAGVEESEGKRYNEVGG
jgi:hypothetical protein